MKKLLPGLITLFIVYFAFALIIREFHTIGTETAIITVTGKGESELMSLNKVYKIEFTPLETEEELGALYAVQSDYDKMSIGSTCNLTITAERCASWADFFKLFGKYDYKIISINSILNSSTKEEAKKVFTEEQAKINPQVLWGIGIIVALFFLISFINKKAKGSFKLNGNKWIANKPAWLEFINGVWTLLLVLVFSYLLIYSFNNSQYLYLATSLIFLLIGLFGLVKEFTSRNNKIVISDEDISVYAKSKVPSLIINWKDVTSVDEIGASTESIKSFDFWFGENKKSIDLDFLNLLLFSEELSKKIREYTAKNGVNVNFKKK